MSPGVAGLLLVAASNFSVMTLVTSVKRAAWSTADELDDELSSLAVISLFNEVITIVITDPDSEVVVDFVRELVTPLATFTMSNPPLNDEDAVDEKDVKIEEISLIMATMRLPES